MTETLPHDHAAVHDDACSCGHVHAHPHGPAPARRVIDAAALVAARGLHFRRNARDILTDVDLDVAPGEIVTLIGPNGAGKTTLVKLILGVERPDAGTISRRFDLRVGYVPQRFEADRAIPMTVARFLSFGLGASREAVRAVLAEVGAGRTETQQLVELSGGETQRVLLARALLRDPNLLVLDEPARGVDYAGEAELYRLIGALRDKRKLGVLLVSHDLMVVMAKSDRVLCINRHVCCEGVPEAVAQHAEYVRLFGPKASGALGIYQHHHDHTHDISGAAVDQHLDRHRDPHGHAGVHR